MRLTFYFLALLLSFCLFVTGGSAQNADCISAIVLCDDGNIAFNPSDIGDIDDFANPNNNSGCLESDEEQSAWYYFEFSEDMPPNSILEFTLTPDGGFGEDYDFAIYGADVTCDNLGSPLRCSYANNMCNFCPLTGLGMGAMDDSEPPSGDGFVAPLMVQPGQGFYLIVDNFLGTSTGFELDWGGSAAPFLNCTVDPSCTMTVLIEDVLEICPGGSPVPLNVIVEDNIGDISYVWSGPGNIIGFLDDVNSPTPTLTVPASFSGDLTFTLQATDDVCTETVPITISLTSSVATTISGLPVICDGDPTTLSADAGFDTYLWSNNATTQSITVDQPGVYSVTVSAGGNCDADATVEVTTGSNPVVDISGDFAHCAEETTTISAAGNFTSLSWPDGSSGTDWTTDAVGDFVLLATSSDGCELGVQFTIDLLDTPVFTLDAVDPLTCINTASTLSASLSSAGTDLRYQWTGPGIDATNETSPSPTVDITGTYTLQITDNVSGCQSAVIEVTLEEDFSAPDVTIATSNPLDCANEEVTLSIAPPPPGITYTVRWESSGMTIANELDVTVSDPGLYTVLATNDQTGCSETSSFDLVDADDEPTAIELALTPQRCSGQSDAAIEVLDVIGGIPPFTYQLNDDSLTTNTLFDNLLPGEYRVTAYDSRGCSITETIELVPSEFQLAVLLPTPIIIDLGDPVFLEADLVSSGQGIDSIIWTASNGMTCFTCDRMWRVDSLVNGAIFTIEVTDEVGCTVSDSTRVVVRKDYAVYLPNVFSPNGDGVNDHYTVFSDVELNRVVTISIYNRWGSLVFTKNDIAPNDLSAGWDGTFKGQDAPSGVYVYVAEVEFIDGNRQILEGDMTLLR